MPVKRIDCDHGQLRRQCPICERDDRIAKLEQAIKRALDVAPCPRCGSECVSGSATFCCDCQPGTLACDCWKKPLQQAYNEQD